MEETNKSREKRQAHEGKENFKAEQAAVSENPEDATKRYHLGNFKATQLLGTIKHLLKRRAESPQTLLTSKHHVGQVTVYRNCINCIKPYTFWGGGRKSFSYNTNVASSKGQLGLFVKIKTTQDYVLTANFSSLFF